MAKYGNEDMDNLRDWIKIYAKDLTTSQVLEVFHDILSERIEQGEENQ